MAIIYPKDENLTESPYSEVLALEALKKLDDSYTIFHSVEWASTKKNRKRTTLWKENDFLIMNKTLGMLVLEIKGGKVSYKDGVFHQVDITTGDEYILSEEKGNDPLTQAKSGKFHYERVFNNKIDNISKRFPIEAAAWFTHSLVKDNLDSFPLQYRDVSGAILDASDLHKATNSIENIFEFYKNKCKTNVTDEEYQILIDTIASDFELIVVPEIIKGEYTHAFLKFTQEQMSLLDYISEQKSATIQGAAGTGKTLIAIEAAKRFAHDNRKVLFLCFNRFLFTELKRRYPSNNIDYLNLHSFISLYNKSGKSVYYNRDEALANISYKSLDYADIIIDEAQDFTNDEIIYFKEYAELVNGHFYVFFDKNQLVSSKQVPQWINDSECKLLLTKNCRNTYEIALTSYNIINADLKQRFNKISGQKPTIIFYDDPQLSLSRLVQHYKLLGYDNTDIVILTLKTEEKSVLYNMSTIGEIPLTSEKTENSILFTTARKFKGLECSVIIVVDIDEKDFTGEQVRLFYVACSRATQQLSLLIDGKEDHVNRIASIVGTKGRFTPKGKIAQKTKTNILNL